MVHDWRGSVLVSAMESNAIIVVHRMGYYCTTSKQGWWCY